MLYHALSKFNGVVYLSQSSINGKGSNIFVGRRCDIEANDYMMWIVLTQRKAKWKEHRIEYKSKLSASPSSSERASWLNGFSLGVQDKLRELTKFKETKIQEYGIVVVPLYDQALSEYKKDQKIKYSKSRKFSYSQSGFDAGKSTQIHKGVKSEKVKMIS
jgi:hypothetical protein